jgi:hypothetical protein
MPTKRFQPGRSAIDLARKQGVVRLRELEQAGISKAAVLRACESGELDRIGRGLYALPGREVTESEALVQVAKRVPAGVVCLLTALRNACRPRNKTLGLNHDGRENQGAGTRDAGNGDAA